MNAPKTKQLFNDYCNFFVGCARFAVSPYVYAYEWAAGEERDFARGILFCALLTAVPILPELCSVTFGLAAVAASLACAISEVLFFVTLFLDVITPEANNHGNGNTYIYNYY